MESKDTISNYILMSLVTDTTLARMVALPIHCTATFKQTEQTLLRTKV